MSTLSIIASSASAATIFVAISRGFLRAGLARRMATLLAKSPWAAIAGALDRGFEYAISPATSLRSGRDASASLTSLATSRFMAGRAFYMSSIGSTSIDQRTFRAARLILQEWPQLPENAVQCAPVAGLQQQLCTIAARSTRHDGVDWSKDTQARPPRDVQHVGKRSLETRAHRGVCEPQSAVHAQDARTAATAVVSRSARVSLRHADVAGLDQACPERVFGETRFVSDTSPAVSSRPARPATCTIACAIRSSERKSVPNNPWSALTMPTNVSRWKMMALRQHLRTNENARSATCGCVERLPAWRPCVACCRCQCVKCFAPGSAAAALPRGARYRRQEDAPSNRTRCSCRRVRD